MVDLTTIPNNPGCYIYRNKSDIIYIGKAKNLKKRVSSYFQKKVHDPKTQALVSNIESVDYIVTDNELEALLLESHLIKEHTPKYNIDLKDSKSFSTILLTDEDFPRLVIARRRLGKGTHFGPFVSAQERDYILHLMRKIFRIRTCKKMPKKACLRYHIHLCDAPCINLISKSEYDDRISKVKMILRGQTSELLSELKTQMHSFSQNKNFEKALEIRNQIAAIEHLNERQNVERKKAFDEDIINYIIKDNKVYLILFNIYKGTLGSKNEYNFDYIDGFLEEFIVQYYSDNDIPKELILPVDVDPSIVDFLKEKKGKKVSITIPKIGEKKQLLDLVKKNIELTYFGNIEKLEELKKKLKLNDTPYVIECFDISHLSGTFTVGSMVQFRNGKPDKTNYRRFKIRTVEGIDDFMSIAEVVRRRYRRLKSESQPYPDLIIIDGGKGQLSNALRELSDLDLKIPIISIAKKFEEIFVPGLAFPITLDHKEKALRFMQEIRDEAHRFAITYNRLLRSKEIK